MIGKERKRKGYAVNLSSKEAKRSRGQRSARERLLAAAVVGAVVVGAVGVGFAVAPDSGLHPLTADVACPVAGCTNGACHGYDAVPEPDGHSEMRCPEAGCTSVECHGWETLARRYHQASDMSLNLWILMPIVLVLGLWVVSRRLSKGERHAGA